MTSVKHQLETLLTEALSPNFLDVQDESHLHAGHREAGDAQETHFRVIIASTAFDGHSKVQQHQMIYRAVNGLMPKPVHALAIDIRT